MTELYRPIPLRPPKRFGSARLSLVAVSMISLSWWVLAADSRFTSDAQKASKFQFARLRYLGGIPDYVKNWYTDYPAMDQNVTKLLARLTGIDPGPPLVVEPSSQAIFDSPFIYTVEPEQMILRAPDVANLRDYLARGGLWFADDFLGDEEFDQFLRQLQQVIPGATPVELDASHPLFHCFFDIDKIIQVTNDSIAKCAECDQWEDGPSGKEPKVFAVLNDTGRISVLMAWNTDLGDGLEWGNDPDYPENYSAYAFKFLSNVIVYSMTH